MIEEILKHRIRRCAVVGTAKNVGKTTALNHLAAGAARAGLHPGLVSFGRDGETLDALTGDPKPPVLVPPSGIFVTLRSLAAVRKPDGKNPAQKGPSGAISEISGTGISTALGEVAIFRNGSSETRMELMGINRVSTLLETQRRMGSYCDVMLVDGALDRRSSAMPLIADGAFLATGAALDGNQDSLVAATVDAVRQLSIEVGRIRLSTEQEAVLGSGRPLVLGGPEDRRAGDLNSGLSESTESDWRPGTGRLSLSGENLPEWKEEETLVLAGALTEAIAASLLDRCKAGFAGTLAVRDATTVFISEITRRRLGASGIRLKVLDGIRLLGIVVNPWTPYGEAMDSPTLVDNLARALYSADFPLPVWDLVSGETRLPGDVG